MTELRDRLPGSSIAHVLSGLRETSAWQEHIYKDIHAHPELSFQETKTAALVASKLKEFGYEVVDGVGRTGVVGILRNGEGQSVLARADMDALPVRENTGLPYASTATSLTASERPIRTGGLAASTPRNTNALSMQGGWNKTYLSITLNSLHQLCNRRYLMAPRHSWLPL